MLEAEKTRNDGRKECCGLGVNPLYKGKAVLTFDGYLFKEIYKQYRLNLKTISL